MEGLDEKIPNAGEDLPLTYRIPWAYGRYLAHVNA